MIVRTLVKRSAYFDSVALMLAQQEVRRLAGVIEAGLVIGTDANKTLLEEAGLLTAEASGAGADDLVISVGADTGEIAAEGLALGERLLTARRRSRDDAAYRPRTIAAARRLMPEATLAAISVPGRYAGGVAREALQAGLHVFLFSDNVALETEVALKRLAAERDLLLMGPDCGTALIGGVGLGFSNRVRRGTIGIVAAAGTGLQEVSMLVHRSGEGISHAIGTGGRDLAPSVGAATMLAGLSLLAADPETAVIVLVSKPPPPEIAARLLGAAQAAKKPVVAVIVGSRVTSQGNLRGAATLDEAASMAVHLAGGGADGEEPAQALPAQEAGRLLPSQRYLRGLFSGGTLCAEAQAVLRTFVGRVRSNAPLDPADVLDRPAGALRGHAVLDLGADEFTQGRLHPMIDPTLRLERLAQDAADPEVGVVLLDVVLGDGAERDPAGRLAPAVAEARRRALDAGRYLCVVGSICGTDDDPQVASVQREALLEAGMLVEGSNARAARLAGLILAGRGAQGEESPEAVIDAGLAGAGTLPDPGARARLLSTPLRVINVGLELFAESLRGRNVPVIDLDWQPPAGGKAHLLDLLDRLEA